MSKRLLSFLLALVMVLGMIPAMAPAANAASNMVAKVEAVGTGYAYDSEKGAFAPTFSSMTAYDPGGNAINIEGFVWSTPFYTKESFGSANRLFYEPEDGVTYYFAIYVDQYVNEDVSYDYTGSKELMDYSVVTLPGFDVECISFMEREMQSYLELTYSAKKVADAPIDPPSDNFIDIDGTKLYDGDTFKGSKGGTLTIDGKTVILNNFNHACDTGIAISGDILYITIIGNNTIDCRSGNLRKAGGSLCFEGTMHDSLTMKRGEVQAWSVLFSGGNYDIPSIYAVYDNYAKVSLEKGASVNVSGDIETAWLRAEDSELSFVNYYCSCKANEHKSLDLTRSRLAYTGGLYCHDLELSGIESPLLWCDVRGGAFKGAIYKEPNRQFYVGQSDYHFYEYMIGTDGGGNSISVQSVYYQTKADMPHLPDYIDVESVRARKVTGYDADVSVFEAVPGTVVTITADPAPEGKVFYRWEIKGLIKDIANPYSPTTTITMDVTNVTAKATYRDADSVIKYTITFESNGGSAVTSQTVEEGKPAVKPADPTKEGYTFKGWYLGNSAYDFSKAVTGNITLTAKWEKAETPTEPKPTDPPATEPKPDDPKPDDPKVEGVTRLAGENRLVTSELIANQLKEKMGVEKFQNIIVASGGTFADALPGSYLAAVKNAPILLTLAKEKYVNQTADYIKANLKDGGTVYILGGESAVPSSMETALTGMNVKRVAGADRFGTNLAILKEAGVKAGDEILVCTAKEFADSLSAAATGKPILLVYKKITDEQKAYLGTLSGNAFCVVGGTSAVPENLEEAMKAYGNVSRLAGKDRLDTSILVAQKYFPNATTSVVAYGWDFPDGLCGGSLAYAMDAPLILAHSKEKLAQFTADYTTKAGIKDGFVLGGDKLVDDTATRAIFGMDTNDVIAILK